MRRLLFTVFTVAISLAARAQGNVDTYVAVNDEQDANTFAVIICNENYKHEVPVPFALNDGAIFKRYLTKTLGVPEKNIKYVPDASLNDMNYNMKWLENVINVKDGQARAIVYYSGHGMPDDESKKAYLLPVDGYSLEPATSGISTEDFYKRLSAMKSRQTLVFLDACFSGSKREGGMMQQARGVAVREKKGPVQGNMVVFAATDAGQTAYPLKEKEHGLFTYCILEALQKSKGCITLGELSDIVTKKVDEVSTIENEKKQTPTITAATSLKDWRDWKMAESEAKRFETMAKPQVQAVAPAASQPAQQQSAPAASQTAKPKRSFLKH